MLFSLYNDWQRFGLCLKPWLGTLFPTLFLRPIKPRLHLREETLKLYKNISRTWIVFLFQSMIREIRCAEDRNPLDSYTVSLYDAPAFPALYFYLMISFHLVTSPVKILPISSTLRFSVGFA